MTKPRLHPQSWLNLRQLVSLHGIDAIEQAVRVLRKNARMHRYIIEVHVRPEGSLSNVYDPSTITVTATDDATALAVAAAVADERGWETSTASIVRKEPLS